MLWPLKNPVVIWARRFMHRHKIDGAHIWIDAAGRELVSRLSPCRPTQDDIDHATSYAHRARARNFRRRLYRWYKKIVGR